MGDQGTCVRVQKAIGKFGLGHVFIQRHLDRPELKYCQIGNNVLNAIAQMQRNMVALGYTLRSEECGKPVRLLIEFFVSCGALTVPNRQASAVTSDRPDQQM